ncbi:MULTISPECIES: DUF6542 domain-containing protein [Pseudonocardia]|uniref:DUF6542 domain-containing protein n=2 Tax=Pseudonocardia TaxID=1847 RepID=A0A1Y2N4G5_PSEAH|nr:MULTISPECIES: DUF6542 domain-containing protein [Pseudonocardia]OSY42374.1 hypothetical protein BG845_01294 [Pseudonocardia autotrophica]TDN75894.1 hypothetical protein C8E95_5079 [Pseudonocardia autotrophica]BBF99866.1 hypothetical protein Pdca_10760 [Pseudonocardia autotrophica]GEC28371.1 hypothetical protein PSA01_54000 [Pseudonocardia saturnea]
MNTTRSSSARRPGGSSPRPPGPGRGGWPVRERSLLRPVLGIPPSAAIGLAVAATALGVLVDFLRIGTVGRVFEVAYLLGCLLAVCWVRRRGIFLPAVQPPLLLAVVVPVVAVLIGAPSGGGTTQSVLMAGAPLINAFPAMAVTTLSVLALAAFRLLRQRLGPDDSVGRLRARLGRDPGGHDPDGPRRSRSERRQDRADSRSRRPDADRRGGRPAAGAARDAAATGSARGTRPAGAVRGAGSSARGTGGTGGTPRSTGSTPRGTGSTGSTARGTRSTGGSARSTGSTGGAGGISGTGGSRVPGRGSSGPTSATRGAGPDATRRRSR